MSFRSNRKTGFNLVELLIVLAVLGVIVAFTLPKFFSEDNKLKQRYDKAMDAMAVMSQATRSYTVQNNGCFPGNISCKVNPDTGAALDGKPTLSSWFAWIPDPPNPEAFNLYNDYLNTHLNFVYRKQVLATSFYCYYLPTHVTVCPDRINNYPTLNGKREMAIAIGMLVDRTPEQYFTGQYSNRGVDTHETVMFFGQSGSTTGGANTYYMKTGFPYLPSRASIFDWPQHPSDTCTVVGGDRCNIP